MERALATTVTMCEARANELPNNVSRQRTAIGIRGGSWTHEMSVFEREAAVFPVVAQIVAGEHLKDDGVDRESIPLQERAQQAQLMGGAESRGAGVQAAGADALLFQPLAGYRREALVRVDPEPLRERIANKQHRWAAGGRNRAARPEPLRIEGVAHAVAVDDPSGALVELIVSGPGSGEVEFRAGSVQCSTISMSAMPTTTPNRTSPTFARPEVCTRGGGAAITATCQGPARAASGAPRGAIRRIPRRRGRIAV